MTKVLKKSSSKESAKSTKKSPGKSSVTAVKDKISKYNPSSEEKFIKVVGAKEHNLKNINIEIPKNKLVVITGLSGSGKSSLVFDTIYAEGQRRFIESLSVYARQFLNMQDKPEVETITGLSPSIAIDQKTTSRNPRSTVGTVTEIYDYLRLLFARIGVPYSPETGLPIESQSASKMVEKVLEMPERSKIYLLAPIVRSEKGEYKKEISNIRKQGFGRIKIDGKVYELSETLPVLDKKKKHEIEVVVDRIVVSKTLGNRLADSVETALKLSDGLLLVEVVSLPEGVKTKFKKGEILTFSEKFSCPVSGFSISEIEPRLFSFNSPFGACESCDGLGTELFFNEELVIPDEDLSLKQGAVAAWQGVQARYYNQVLTSLSDHFDFDLNTPYKALSTKIKQIILHGSDQEIEIKYEDGIRSFKKKQIFEGVINNMKRKYREAASDYIRDDMLKYQSLIKCTSCEGARLNEQSLAVKVAGTHIGEITRMSISDAYNWFEGLPKKLNSTQNQIADRILKEICKRLNFLKNVGLEYLTINRESGTLSGGESQRIRLASQIGSGLSGVIYVLDEPSIGLHQSDNQKLITTLKELRDIGNSVLVVEHDEEMMREADYLIDIGPGAGIYGGTVLSEGSPEDVIADPNSITGQYLSGKKSIEIPKVRRSIDPKRVIKLKNATTNNLKNVDLTVPLNTLCGVSGISGGGKSSLIIHTLYKALNRILNKAKDMPGAHDGIEGSHQIDKLIEIDQSPIGRTPRSNPCTYTGAFSPIRDFYTELPESKARGYKAGRFSFNVKGGRCETCQGDGMIKIEMHFLPDVYVKCDSCHGKRYNRETLEVKYKGKSISDILQMNSEEAAYFFKTMPHIYDKLKALCDVGLGYMKIGQSATTLSGGEAQRIKLAKELSKKATGNTFYILDEPTTGLHFEDIKKLLKVLHQLVDNGNSMLVIEHNLDVLKTTDWMIDIGPQGGHKGGYIVAEGTPEQVAKNPKSVTGKYLAKVL
ncbi:MAG: excinuclease ABC subunit A [Rickettsiales bacterium]|jgi:excinuclease ABC subunit A